MLRSLFKWQISQPKCYALAVTVFAVIPFAVRIGFILSGATGYLLHSVYKIFQFIIPIGWRYSNQQLRGWKIIWPVEEPLPQRKVWIMAVALAVGLGALGILATTLLTHLLDIDLGAIQAQLNTRFSISFTGAIIIVMFLATVNAGLEELHFRYWLDRELSKVWGSRIGMAASATAFGCMHLLILAGTGTLSGVTQFIIFVALFIAGVSWSLLARQSGGIHAAWLSHGLTNVILMGWGLRWLGYI